MGGREKRKGKSAAEERLGITERVAVLDDGEDSGGGLGWGTHLSLNSSSPWFRSSLDTMYPLSLSIWKQVFRILCRLLG